LQKDSFYFFRKALIIKFIWCGVRNSAKLKAKIFAIILKYYGDIFLTLYQDKGAKKRTYA
jgi:hypothetical protein